MKKIHSMFKRIEALFKKAKEELVSFWKKYVVKKIQMHKEIKPIVFMNTPIDKKKKDAIGIQASVNAIQQAISEGAKMIGVIAEYGAGKTSLTELLIKKKRLKVTRINLWDTLIEDNVDDNQEINPLTKAFIYQMAMGKSPYRAEYVNKILSNNYGVISFSTGFIRTWIFMILAAILETLYLIGNGVTSQTLVLLGQDISEDWTYFINDFSPVCRLIAIFFAGFAILDASIVYSHWKDECKRTTDVGEVFSAYSYMHRCLRGWFKHRLIVIEDLDRIEEPEKVITFLKELYRYNNLCNVRIRKAPVFIISIAPEARLKSAVDDSKEISHIYSKIFDYTVSLKPIHYDDYETILQDILDSEKNKKARLNAILPEKEKMLVGKISQAFTWLYRGENLTLRDLKERLNDSIELYIELLNKNYGGNPAISFRTCVCVTYLEKTYGKAFYELIANERLLNDILQASYQWRNSIVIKKLEDFAKEVKKLINNEMADDLAELIYLKVLDTDYRMYFYSFPKGSYIKNADEKDICNCIEYPNDYQYEHLEVIRKVDRLREQKRLEKIYEAIKKIALLEERNCFPKIILEQVDLFESAYFADEDMCLQTLVIEFMYDEGNDGETIRVLSNIKSFMENYRGARNLDEAHSFWVNFSALLLSECAKSQSASRILYCRRILIKVFQQDIVLFKELFTGMIDETEFVPFITKSEIEEINSLDITLELMNENNIPQEAYEEIKEVFSQELCGKKKEKALVLHENLYRSCKTPEVDEYLCDFMRVNKVVIEDIYFSICESVKQGKLSSKKFIQYLNVLDVLQLSELHLAPINTMNLNAELKEEIIVVLLKQGYYELPLKYYCYKNELEKVDFENNSEAVLESCKEINKTDSALIPLIRSEIIKQNDGECSKKYNELFWCDYPMVSIEEMQQFKTFSDAMFAMDASNLEEDSLQDYLDFINAKERVEEDCYTVFENLFKPENLNCTDINIVNLIINGLNYDKIKMMTMSEEELTEILEWLRSALRLTVVDNVIETMKLMKWILPEYEKLILNNRGEKVYVELINEINLCTEYTIEWIQRKGPKYGLNTVITTRLLESGLYEHYLVGKILFEQRFDYPISKEVDDALVSLYYSDSPIIGYLSQSDEFIGKLMKDRVYTGFQLPLDIELIKPFYRVKQTYDFMKFMLERGSKQQIIDYLETLNEIETQEDSGEIAKLLINNIGYLEDEKVYNHVRFRLWENTEKARGYKGTLTQKRNEYLRQIGKE